MIVQEEGVSHSDFDLLRQGLFLPTSFAQIREIIVPSKSLKTQPVYE